MMVRKSVVTAAALAALTCASAAWATDNSVAASAAPSLTPAVSPNDLSLSPVALDASGPTTLTPLMFWLGDGSVGKFLTSNNMTVTGFVEGGYFYDTSAPRMSQEEPTLIAFPGPFSNRGMLNQADLTISKTAQTGSSWDWGFLFEQGYGVDDTFIHSSGLGDNRAGGPHPRNQYDLVQANVSLFLPWGNGVTLTAGKFVALIGEEVIAPTGNAFYTHSYSFTYGDPATNTGVLASYTFPKAWNGNDVKVTGGISRGWNQSLRDGNGAIDFLGQVAGNVNSSWSYIINAEVGPESNDFTHTHIGPFGEGPGEAGNNGNYWTTVEAILTDQVSDQLKVSGDLLYTDVPHIDGVRDGAPGQDYGIAAYGSYKISPMVTANVRGEYFRDQNGFSTGAQANYYEVTVGAQIHPLPNDNIFQWLQLRPEVREDWSDRPVYNFSHSGGGDFNEFTVAMDAIMQF